MKILIAGHDLKFIQFYIDHLQKSSHQVELDIWENHVAHDVKKSFELLDWAEVIFCEWGLGNVLFYSKYKRKNQKLIVRLHRQELETTYLMDSDIDNIDSFITVSPYIYEEFSRTFNLPREKMNLIFNNVNLTDFKNYGDEDRKFNIGMVGYLPKLKRMDIALDIFEELYKNDQRYTIHFKGKRPEELKWLWRIDEEREYYEAQFKRIESSQWKDNVFFEPFGDVVEFYNRMEFILSVSDVESFHLAVAEGMACGAIPIIMNWEGAKTIYNNYYFISNVKDTLDYVKNKRKNRNQITNDMKKEVKTFDQDNVIKEIDEILFT